ncbi:hypothetical protein LPJ55_002201 [Coemansia sp. RSA 990]|nr:hypothetical protein LPJ55_002201 [Coemansia sp. RSA 990]
MSRLGDGRTSDLIRRFENLALEKSGGNVGKQPQTKPMPKRLSSIPIDTAQGKGQEAPKASQPTPLASIAAAQSALSAAITHAQPTQSEEQPAKNDAKTAELSTKSRIRASSDVTRPPAIGHSVAEAGEPGLNSRSRSSTIDSASARSYTSQLSPVPMDKIANVQSGKGLLARLNRRADIDPALQVSPSSWLAFAQRCVDEARLCQETGDLETAYVRYMMACNIISKKFHRQRESSPVAKDPAYLKLRKDVSTWIIDELEGLHQELKRRSDVEAMSSDSQVMTAEQLDQMESKFSQMYPENPSSVLQADNALETPQPTTSQTNRSDSSLSGTRLIAEQQSRFDEIDAQVQQNDASVKDMQTNVAVIGQNRGNRRVAVAMSPTLPSIDEAPKRSNYIDPNATTCTPQELRSLISQAQASSSGRPTILLLDVRPQRDFAQGRINHRFIVNIDPLSLPAKCTSSEIESSLVLVSEEQQTWFHKRDEFDVVVYVSQSMRMFGDTSSKELAPLNALNSAIYHYEYRKPLQHPPLFLIGGFDAWLREVGSEYCLWSQSSQVAQTDGQRQPSPPQHTSASATTTHDISGMLAYHAPTSGLSQTPPSQVQYPAKAAASGAGTVHDFFQQHNGYPQQQHQSQQQQQQHGENLAESPALGKSFANSASPSKFSFQAPPPDKPKPLPQTPKRPSAEQIFTFPSQQEIQQHAASPLFKVAEDRKGKSPEQHRASAASQVFPADVKGSGTIPEMAQRPSSSRVKPLPEKPPITGTPQIIQVNTAEVPSAPSSDMPMAAPGPRPARKRPSLLKRLTQGWRSNPPLQPIPEEEPNAYHQQGDPSHGVVSAAAAGAATGLLGRLFGSMKASGAPKDSAEPQAQQYQQMQQQQPQMQQHQMQQPSVPNVAVVHSPPPGTPDSYSVDLHGAGPQPYPPQAPSAAHLSAMPIQQHISSGSLGPPLGPHGPSVGHTPHNQSQAMQFGSMYPGGTQTPLPGQHSQMNIQSQSFRPDAAGFASLPQQQQQHSGGPLQALPMSVPLQQGRPHGMPPNAPPTSQYPGVNPYGQPPSTVQGAEQAAGTASKLMSAMASIPLIGSLFGKKQKPEVVPPAGPGQMPPPPPPGQYHGQYGGPPSTYYTRPTSGMSGYTSYTSHAYPPSASPISPQNILEKVKNAGKWYFIPMFSFLLRESVIREIRPLVGRYAMRYPLVEAEERAAISKIAQAKKGIVHAGGLRAVDAREFRHAAPALRYNTLDQRLDNIFVPRFSRLRKYRRAPEVWDDPEAHDIYQRVQSRLQAGNNTRPGVFNRGRNPGEPALRGGGRRNPRETLGNHDDFNCSSRGLSEIDGAAGSGVHLVAEPAYSSHSHPAPSLPLAYRLGDFVTKLFSKRHEPPVRAQSTASYLDHSAENSRRQTSLISPRSRGMSRIEEDEPSEHIQVDVREEPAKPDDASEELRSLKREPSAKSSHQETDTQQRPPKRFMRWFFGRGPTDAPEQHRASEPGALPDRFYADTAGLPDAGILNAALRRSKPDVDERNDELEPEPEPEPAAKLAKADKATQAEPAAASSSSNNPPMFPPFSHLPPRLVDQLLHRVGEPRVFIGSAKSQLVPPTNSAEAGDEVFGDTSPYRTGTEWNFVESVKFSSPYPTSQKAIRNRKLWSKQQRKRRLLLKPRNNEISRWPLHLEMMRDFMQMLALVLGACGFTKARLDSSVGDRWPWIVVAGIPEALGFLWADLSTTTGKSIGFFIFFGALAAIALGMWMYGLYLEDPSRPKRQPKEEEEAEQEKSEASEKDALVTYEEELVPVPGPLDFIGRLFSKVTRRQRMHAVYVVLSTLYVPVIKLCLEAIVWGQGYWPVPNPYRTEDSPQFDSQASESGMRDPGSFCYTTTMHTGRFNAAFVVLPLASLLFIALGLIVPWQVHRLAEHHKPRIPGWADGKVPGYKLPPKEQVSISNMAGSGAIHSNGESRPPAASTSAAPPAPDGTSVPREAASNAVARNAPATRDGTTTRDDPNPMLYAEPIWQGIQQLNLINPEMLGYLATIYGMMYGANGMGGAGGRPDLSNLGGLFSNAWKHIQQWWSKETEEDPYMGMEKDEAYQARLRDMKHSHRNRHLATVQYRRALDTDTCDMRFLYGGQYPAHAGDPARMLLWKLLAVVLAVTLSKDNCWSRGHSRQSLDIGRCTMLLLVALLMLRSLHAHRPFFDPTANLSGLLARIGVCGAAIFAFPLFLLSDPLSQAHMGLCVTLAVLNLLVVMGMVMLLWSALPGVQMAVQGSSAPLTLSPGILVATNPYDPRLRRLLIERVWQDTWSAILLGSRDFRLLPGHRIAFCKTNVHPPYMVNYIGFAAERHLENLYLYSSIGRRAYCQAILLERNSDQRTGLMDEIVRVFTGPDMYFNPFASDQPADSVAARFRLAQSEIRSWFGKVYILHFPFMVCIIYDDLPNVIVPIIEENDLQLYLQQNQDPLIVAKRDTRRRLRALHGQYITLTFIEHSGPDGSHLRYCLPQYADENEQYLAQFAGRRRLLYRGLVTVHQHGEQIFSEANVTPGFACAVELTDELPVEDEHLVNNLDRASNAFRREFWQHGRVSGFVRSAVSQRSRNTLQLNEHNRHLLGVTDDFEETSELRALFDENSDIIDQRLPIIQDALEQYARECHAGFIRKRTGLTPSFHIDVFAPGPESYHVQNMVAQGQNPPHPATPALFGSGSTLNGQWQNDEHGRLSFIPTMEQLAERLERLEENRYVRDLMVDHRDDIVLLYERLRTLVPSESNDPVKFAWYIFWDDLYRRYGQQVRQFKEYDTDFNPLYPQSLPYYPLPRHRLEVFLYRRKLFKPLRAHRNSQAAAGTVGDVLARLPLIGKLFGGRMHGYKMDEEYALDPMPVPNYVPGIDANGAAGIGDAHVWRVGDHFDGMAVDGSDNAVPFEPGCPASGFIHSGLLNRLYAWLDIIAYGIDR